MKQYEVRRGTLAMSKFFAIIFGFLAFNGLVAGAEETQGIQDELLQALTSNDTAADDQGAEQPAARLVTKFNPINLSDQNIPLLSQSFRNITLEEFNIQKLQDNGTYKVIEETRNTLLQGVNTTELFLRQGGFNLNNTLLAFQVKLFMPKADDAATPRMTSGEENVNGMGNMSVTLNSAYVEDSYAGQLLFEQKVNFKKQSSSDQDVDQLPLDDNMDVYLAHFALTPCQYIRFIQVPPNDEMPSHKLFNQSIFQKHKIQQRKVDKQGGYTTRESTYRNQLLNLNIRIEQVMRQVIVLNANRSAGNQTAPAEKPNEASLGETKFSFNFSTTVFAVQQNKIRNYMCQTPLGLQNILNLKSLYNSSESVANGEVYFHLDSKISNHLNPLFSSFEYIPDQNQFYAIGSGKLDNGAILQGTKSQQLQALQKSYKPSLFKFDFAENAWIEITKQSDLILYTGQKVYRSLWPKFKFGQSVVQYFGYLVVFGASPVQEVNGQLSKQSISIYDTQLEQWFFIEPEDTLVDRQTWPSNFQNRVLMGATPLLNNGLIVYIGGYQQDQQINSTKHGNRYDFQSQSSSQILILNIEFIIEKIVLIKNQQSIRRTLKFTSSEIWSDFQLVGDDDQDMKKLDLNGHSTLLLPELSSVLIMGGRQNNDRMTDNTKLFVLNLQKKTLTNLDPWSAFQAILPARMRCQLSIDGSFSAERQAERTIRVSVQSGYNQLSGEVFHDHWTMDIDLENMKYRLKLNQAASLSPIIVPAYSQMISYVTYDNNEGSRDSEPLALIQQNQDLNFVILNEDQCSEILLGEYTNIDQATQQRYIACQNQVQKNKRIQNKHRNCPPGYVEQHSKGLNYCMICGENKFYNFTSGQCQPCMKSMACFLGSLSPQVNLKQELNKFNVSNNPSLYDTGPLRKQMIQESYFGHASILFLSAFILAFILIHIPRYQKHVIRLIVNSDFLMISGGDHKTFIGGLITIIYIVGNFFVIMSLLQTKVNLNEWIDSTQMAPQTSDLKVNNDLYVELHFFMNQISLDKPKYGKDKPRHIHYANLCELGVFRLQKQEELNVKRGRYKHQAYGPQKIFTGVKETNCTRLPLSSQSIAHNTGETVYNLQLLINDFVLDDPRETQVVKIIIDNLVSINGNNLHDTSKILLQNETVFLNYFSYQVQTIWNSISNIDENEVDGEDVEEQPLTLADVARNQIPRNSNHKIKTYLQKKFFEQRMSNKKPFWERLNPFAQIEDPEAQRLRCVGCSKLAGKITSEDYQERTFSRNTQLEINLKATPVYYQNFLNYQSYQGYQLHYISMRYGEIAAATTGMYQQEPLQLNMRDLSIFQKSDGNFQRAGTIPFSNQNFNSYNMSVSDSDYQNQIAASQSQMPTEIPGSIFTNILQQASNVAGQQMIDSSITQYNSPDMTNNMVTNQPPIPGSVPKQQSSFVIDINFNLSENISQVRVSGRKSWLSMFAEILAFMAGLRFWATLLKYMMNINNIGRYYDRMHKIYTYEEEQMNRKQGRDHAKLLTAEQKEAYANKALRYSHGVYPGEDVLSANTAHTHGTLGSRFEVKFAKKQKKNAGTSPMGSVIKANQVEKLDEDGGYRYKPRQSKTFVNQPEMMFPLEQERAAGGDGRNDADSDQEDIEGALKENYQWTPRNLLLPDSRDGDFELHVQTLNDNDEVQQEQSFDSNMMPIETKYQQIAIQKKGHDNKFNIKYDKMVEDDSQHGKKKQEITGIAAVPRGGDRKYDYF